MGKILRHSIFFLIVVLITVFFGTLFVLLLEDWQNLLGEEIEPFLRNSFDDGLAEVLLLVVLTSPLLFYYFVVDVLLNEVRSR